MPDYIYLLENRLSAEQQHALHQLREVAREAGIILFLTGDAVRDLSSGHAVRDMEVAVHANALKLKKAIQRVGGKIWGEDEVSRSLYLCFPGTVCVDLVSTHRAEYPKPGKPVFHSAAIQEDLRRRDFTVNAMAISLNEGSYGLLMDPLNGAADIEAHTLRLVSNYGFLDDPSLLIRAIRYKTRLGWELDPRSQIRYDNAREEGVIAALSDHARAFELEQIGHEDDGLSVLRALEAEGWMKVLFPAWTSAKADEEKLKALHDLAVELLLQGVHANVSAAQMELLTAKLGSRETAALKKELLRPGFVEEWNSLDQHAAGFQKVLLAKENQTPSAAYKLFTGYDPEAVLWLGFTSNTAAVKERYEQFLKIWPEARQRIPYVLMQEMRITPELPAYNDILHQVFLELIDGRLTTPEEQKTFLEPYSPPAPPPQVTIKRSRSKRSAEKLKERSFEDEEETEESLGGDEDLDDIGGDEEESDLTSPRDEFREEAAGGVEKAQAEEKAAEKTVLVPQKVSKKENARKPSAVSAAEAKPAKQPAKQADKLVLPKTKPVRETKPAAKAKAAPKAAKKPVAKALTMAKQPAPVAKKAAPPAKAVSKPVAKKAVTKPAVKPKPAKVIKSAKAAIAKKKPIPKPTKAAHLTKKAQAKKPVGKSTKKR